MSWSFLPKEDDWKVIRTVLTREISTYAELRGAIFAIVCEVNGLNSREDPRELYILEDFLKGGEFQDENERFWNVTLPFIQRCALKLETLPFSHLIPLESRMNVSVTLSKFEVVVLLASAFLCVLPFYRPTEKWCFFSFLDFFCRGGPSQIQKLRMILNYFSMMNGQYPNLLEDDSTGCVTYIRHFLPENECPVWQSLNFPLGPVEFRQNSPIESIEGAIHADFANRYIGGGVLGSGCVQEEILFCINPECMIAICMSERMEKTEAIAFIGAEQFSRYRGYGMSTTFDGQAVRSPEKDMKGRPLDAVVGFDAMPFIWNPLEQFELANIVRELNKAYVAFLPIEEGDSRPFATGRWGCGAFRGDPELKALIQMMAAAASGRKLIYCSFGEDRSWDDLQMSYFWLVQRGVTVEELFKHLVVVCKAERRGRSSVLRNVMKSFSI